MEKHTQREKTYGHGERVRCLESVTWKLTLPYVKQRANGDMLYISENSTQNSSQNSRFCINLEGWDG